MQTVRLPAGPRTLWLPVAHVGTAWTCVIAWASYLLLTMSRDLSFFDSPELAMTAVQGGLAHPPGQVLHTLVGGLLVRSLPGSPLFILNALSAICGALCLFPAIALAEIGHAKPPSSGLNPIWYPIATLVLCHGALWEQSTRVEVYSMATFLGLWTLAKGTSLALDNGRETLRLGFGAGLTASANPVFAILVVLALLPSLLMRGARGKFILLAGCGALLGLVPYVYLFIAPHRDGAFVWGDTTSLDGLVHYVTGADFQTNLRVTSPIWWQHAVDLLTRESGRWLWPSLLFGTIGALSERTTLARTLPAILTTLLAVAYMTRNAVWYPEIPDYVSYLAPSLHAAAAMAVSFAARLWNDGMRVVSALLVATLCGTSLLAPPSMLTRDRSTDRTARILATETLRAMPRNALAILSSDHLAWPALYLQRVEGLRRDVVIFPRGLASSTWLWRSLYRDHPSLQPFPLRGPGGASSRVRRFVDAQPSRPLVAEEVTQLAEIGVPGCIGPWFVSAQQPCSGRTDAIIAATHTLAQLGDTMGHTDPSTEGAIAVVSYNLGESALRLGDARVALDYLLAPLPPKERALAARIPAASLESLPAWRGPRLAWQRPRFLGDRARNVFLASQVAAAAGEVDLAKRWLSLAAQMDLPEATKR